MCYNEDREGFEMLREREFDLEWFNSEKIKLGDQPIELATTKYSY